MSNHFKPTLKGMWQKVKMKKKTAKIQREENLSFDSKLNLYKITIHSSSGVTFYLPWQVTIPWRCLRNTNDKNIGAFSVQILSLSLFLIFCAINSGIPSNLSHFTDVFTLCLARKKHVTFESIVKEKRVTLNDTRHKWCN